MIANWRHVMTLFWQHLGHLLLILTFLVFLYLRWPCNWNQRCSVSMLSTLSLITYLFVIIFIHGIYIYTATNYVSAVYKCSIYSVVSVYSTCNVIFHMIRFVLVHLHFRSTCAVPSIAVFFVVPWCRALHYYYYYYYYYYSVRLFATWQAT